MNMNNDFMKTNTSELTENKFYKSTFDKINPERKQAIIDSSIYHFAKFGFKATNINHIAKKAGISIGSMYSYVESKEDLFLTIIEYGHDILIKAFSEVDFEQEDHFQIFEDLLRITKKYAIDFPEMNQIYLDLSTQGMSHLADRLTLELEDITSRAYHSVLKRALECGKIDKSIDINVASFCLDNLVMMFQFSYTSDYYKKRMRIFLETDNPDEEGLINSMVSFIRRSLTV